MNTAARVFLSMLAVGGIAFGSLLSAGAQTHERLLYLRGAAFPESLLTSSEPSAETVKNLDRTRNDDPGLTIESGGSGRREFDDARYQDFVTPTGEVSISGPATLTVWMAPADFLPGITAELRALLLDCNEFGFACEDLATGTATVTWADPISFSPVQLTISLVEHTFLVDRTLKLRLTAETTDESAVWLAYDSIQTPSTLAIAGYTPPSTTMTTTTVNPPTTHPDAVHAPSTTATTTALITATAPSTTATAPSTTTMAPPTTTTSPRAEVPLLSSSEALDPSVFDLSQGVQGVGPGTAIASPAAVLRVIPATLSHIWPWLASLAGVLAAALWRDRRNGGAT